MPGRSMIDERLLRTVREGLRASGLHASLVVRDLDGGRELAIDSDVLWPLASLAKLPVAVAVLAAVERGELSESEPIQLLPGDGGVSPGTDRFQHPATVALGDLLSLSLTISDNAASDALLHQVGLERVAEQMEAIGIEGITLRHGFRVLGQTALERFEPHEAHLAHTLAIRGHTPSSGHPVPQLDTSRTNSGTARALADLLEELWRPQRLKPQVAVRIRSLLKANVIRHRLAPDLASDQASWASKTGTLLNLRHEAGVLTHDDGGRFIVTVMSSSSVPAAVQPAAEAALGAAARTLHHALRG